MAEALMHGRCEPLDAIGLPDVELGGQGRASGVLDLDGRRGQVVGVPVAEGHVGAKTSERRGDGAPDAHGGARHNRDAIGQQQIVGSERHGRAPYTPAPR